MVDASSEGMRAGSGMSRSPISDVPRGLKELPWYSFAEVVCANLLPVTNGNKMRAYAIAQAVIRNELADARRQGDQRYAGMLFLALHLVERAADEEASRIVADRPVPYELTPRGMAEAVRA